MENLSKNAIGVTVQCLVKTAQWLGTQVHSHFPDEGTEAQSGQVLASQLLRTTRAVSGLGATEVKSLRDRLMRLGSVFRGEVTWASHVTSVSHRVLSCEV